MQEYASDVGISLDEAAYRLGIQDEAGNLDAALVGKESDTFAGLWIQHSPEFRIIVWFTSDGKETIQPYIENGSLDKDIVDVRTASVSLQELEKRQSSTLNLIRDLGLDVDSGINVPNNQVEVYVTDRALFDTSLQKAKIQLPDHVQVITVDSLTTEVANIYAGLVLVDCTSGFSVQNSSGTKGITTSAHCPNSQFYNGTALTYQQGWYNGPYDVQWHTASTLTIRNMAYDGQYDTMSPYFRYITGTKSRVNQALNEFVCKYGKTTGYGCGYIIDKNATTCCPVNPIATYIRVSRANVNLADPGDSGGPVYSGETAYGIIQGHNGNDLVYMPINYFSNLGLTVLIN